MTEVAWYDKKLDEAVAKAKEEVALDCLEILSDWEEWEAAVKTVKAKYIKEQKELCPTCREQDCPGDGLGGIYTCASYKPVTTTYEQVIEQINTSTNTRKLDKSIMP